MEAVEAAGFASAIIAFIEFSCKIVKGSYEIYQSSAGTTADNDQIERLTDDLAKVTRGLALPGGGVRNGSSPGHHQKALEQLANECTEVAGDLTIILNDLKIKDGIRSVRSLQAKWKSMRQEPVIASLEKRLDRYQSRILLHLQFILR